jgi:hypothetical protein
MVMLLVIGTLRVPFRAVRESTDATDGTRSVPIAFSGSPESRTQRHPVISRVWATGPRLPSVPVVVRFYIVVGFGRHTLRRQRRGGRPDTPSSHSGMCHPLPTSVSVSFSDPYRSRTGLLAVKERCPHTDRRTGQSHLRHPERSEGSRAYRNPGEILRCAQDDDSRVNGYCDNLGAYFPRSYLRELREPFTQWAGRCSNPRPLVFSQVLHHLSYRPSKKPTKKARCPYDTGLSVLSECSPSVTCAMDNRRTYSPDARRSVLTISIFA